MTGQSQVLDFWLNDIGADGWYKGGEDIDARCLAFRDLCSAARAGGLAEWKDSAAGSLAYLIVTDQFARNVFRGSADAFATDRQARAAARHALDQGWDLATAAPERQFFYLPFEHSEDPKDQALAVRLMTERMPSDPELVLHARAHQQIIARFGRFPFRNVVLGRESSAEEAVFLAEGGYMAIVKALKG